MEALDTATKILGNCARKERRIFHGRNSNMKIVPYEKKYKKDFIETEQSVDLRNV